MEGNHEYITEQQFIIVLEEIKKIKSTIIFVLDYFLDTMINLKTGIDRNVFLYMEVIMLYHLLLMLLIDFVVPLLKQNLIYIFR